MKKLLIFGSPLILFIELLCINFILELIRLPYDMAVLAGVFLICAFIALNYLLITFIIKTFKK